MRLPISVVWLLLLILLIGKLSAFEITIDHQQFDALLDETKNAVNEGVKSVNNSILAVDKTTDKILKSVDDTTHYLTTSIGSTVDLTMRDLRLSVLNITDQICTTAKTIEQNIVSTAGKINGDLILTFKGALGDVLSTVDRLSSKFEKVANDSVTRTTEAMSDVINHRAVDLGKAIIGSAFFFGFIQIISRLIPRIPQKAT